jgi:molecular chaperone DnaK
MLFAHQIAVTDSSSVAHQVGAIVKELFGKEPSRGVNPDEVVAMGAAIQVLHLVLACS